jgi:hypothetical protein
MKSQDTKPKYRIRNCPEYNAALVDRGDLTIWVDEAALDGWRAAYTGQRGAPPVYSDLAIESMALLKVVYHLPLRATEGLLRSVLALMNVALPVPDYTTLSRRLPNLEGVLPPAGAQPTSASDD